jgi:hypothetical protein
MNVGSGSQTNFMDHFSVSEVEGEYEGVSEWRVWKGERRRKREREKRG